MLCQALFVSCIIDAAEHDTDTVRVSSATAVLTHYEMHARA